MQFEQRRVSAQEQWLIKRLLCERLSLRGIGRAVSVTMRWLMGFIVKCYEAAPDPLNVPLPKQPHSVVLQWNHIGAIRYFLSYYNLELARA